MEYNRELLFFFSALGAFNGLVLSLYFLLFAKPEHISNKFLGAFLLMISIRVGKSVFFHFNPDLSFHYLQFGLSACFFIGPFLYFYIKSVVEPKSSIKNTWRYHISILVPTVVIFGYIYPFKDNINLWRPYLIKAIYIQWFLYILASMFIMKPIITKVFKKKEKLGKLDLWLLSIIAGNILILASYYFTSFVNYISGALAFSFLLYLLVLFLFFGKNRTTILLNTSNKYADKKIDAGRADQLVQKLEKVMTQEELYKNANLKSSDVAKRIQVTTHQFSQLLNDNLGKNFSVFINEYRIEAAKNMLGHDNNLTLEAIGYECGFNSKSTFFTTFKKLVGATPSQFKNSSNL